MKTSRLLSLVILVLLALALLPGAGTAQGNSEAAHLCQQGGWQTLQGTDGTTFANQDDCVSHAAEGGTLEPIHPAMTRCRQEAVAAGVDPTAFTIIAGTENDETLTPTAGPDLICGFGGADYVITLGADDVFLGGDGNEYVSYLYGVFLGGDGSDSVKYLYGGTFNGGGGDDLVGYVYDGGTFNGGVGDDLVYNLYEGGTFNGGDGNDRVDYLHVGGTFNQE